jgi:hypothetical protein
LKIQVHEVHKKRHRAWQDKACPIEEFAMKTAKFIISILYFVTIMAFWAGTGNAADCNVTKEGTLVVSPGELQFYVTHYSTG